jgi:hypothetical protein
LISGCIGNIAQVYEQASPWEIEDGKIYYFLQRDKCLNIGAKYNFKGIAELAAMFAALSPNNDELGNYRDLEKVLQAYCDRVGPPIVSSYPINSKKAYRIASGEMPDAVLRGKKVINFWKNTLDPSDDYPVTIDGHIVSVWAGRRLLLRRRSDSRETAVITPKTYDKIADHCRVFAKRVKLRPNQVQSICWLTWKRVNNIRYSPQLKFW